MELNKVRDDKRVSGDQFSATEKDEGCIVRIVGLEERKHYSLVGACFHVAALAVFQLENPDTIESQGFRLPISSPHFCYRRGGISKYYTTHCITKSYH
jgi:hypothetical protein